MEVGERGPGRRGRATRRRRRPAPTAARFKFAFAALLVAIAFAATYASSREAFSGHDLRNIVPFGAAVNAVAFLVVLFALRRKNAANAVLSLIVLASVGSAYLVHTDLWLAGNRVVFLVPLCAMSLAGLFVAFRVIDESRWGGAALSAAALLGLGAAVAGGNPPAAHTPVSGDVSNIRHVSFQRTPNLYFVSFESMVPRALLRKHLGVETTGFHDLFDAEMRRFPNFFADLITTRHSLSSVLALEAEVYYSQRDELFATRGRKYSNPYLFSGRNPSPLLDILRRNGYETTSIYYNSFIGGERKGPYIDNYVRVVEPTICGLLDRSLRSIAFWGYCDWRLAWKKNRRERQAILDETPIIEAIKKASAKDGPQFVMAHMRIPGHTPRKSFRYGVAEQLARFRNIYVGASEESARHLGRIIRHLEENDPEAILLVYSDHGPYLSAGMRLGDKIEGGPAFIVQDRFGIQGGIWPRGACAIWLDEASAKGWMTILDAVHAVLRCLSGGESALVEPRGDRYPQESWLPRRLGGRRMGRGYQEFVYE